MTKPDENGWMPIETAPKDGTTVLLYCPEGVDRPYYSREESPPNICFGFWGNASQFYADTQQHWRAVDFETDTFGGSEWTGSWVEHSFIDVAPTHWQYLPGAPKPPFSGRLQGAS